MTTTNDEPQYNANCPYCGAESLMATVQSTNSNVPLRAADYDFDEGIPEDTEITLILCVECHKEVSPNHYFDHGPGVDACDCVEIKEEGPSDM